MKILPILIFIGCSISSIAHSVYENGDIIFHESQSQQSKAIKEVTNSRWSHVGILFQDGDRWFVAEAVQPVKVTPLSSFIARGKNKDFRVYRLPSLTNQQKTDLRIQVTKMMGRNYDIYFEWSDKLIYCSELVYKAFINSTGVEIGKVQKYRELNLNGPYAKELIRRRLKDTGRTLNLDEPIVTPGTQLEDSDLVLVKQSGN